MKVDDDNFLLSEKWNSIRKAALDSNKYCSSDCVLFPCRIRDDYIFDSISSICAERYICEDAQKYLYK